MTKCVVLVGYARCGVTVLNRYLASDSRLVCLSEINSKFVCPTEPNTPREQMRRWYGTEIDAGTIVDEIAAVAALCDRTNRTLLVRDWSFGSFTPLRYNNFEPSKTFNTLDDLNAVFDGEVVVMALVRDPVDVWLSMRNSAKTFHDRELAYYRDFAAEVMRRGIPVFKYEDLCRDKDSVLRQMYSIIELDVPTHPTLSDNVIGDINYPESSRGVGEGEVCILPRREASDEDRRFVREQTHVSEIARLLSYVDTTHA